jgi:hypothetical protein
MDGCTRFCLKLPVLLLPYSRCPLCVFTENPTARRFEMQPFLLIALGNSKFSFTFVGSNK